MKRSLLLMLPLCAALTACQTTNKQSVCDGFKKLTPSLDTTVTILRKDRPFADQVASHNKFGTAKNCWK
jgi:histidine ammonia-lyase